MTITKRPYIIIPKLIEQSTWGGNYIAKFKNWLNKTAIADKKIGQSYELYNQSKLLLSITDSSISEFDPEIGFADNDKIINEDRYLENKDFISLNNLINQYPEEVLGKKVFEKIGKMAILIKFTQALGNSFQLHIKQNINHPRWHPKAESWYYFEKGLITYGIKPKINLDEYKKICLAIDTKMHQLSNEIKEKRMNLSEAQIEAQKYINNLDPWQFVNLIEVNKYDLIDLSPGGIHHSWEKDKKSDLGNVLYEIQEDVMDPVSTVRCFDQGNFKKNGDVRELHIDDYFNFLDTNLESNNITYALRQTKNNQLLSTQNYSLDILEIKNKLIDSTNESFCHLFVREGDVEIMAENGKIRLTQGHSCFIPWDVNQYEIKSNKPLSVLLKTYVEV